MGWTSPAATALAVAAALFASAAHALPTLNLSNATYNNVTVSGVNAVSGTIGGAITNSMGTVIFARDSTQPAGTGVFNPFLRLDCKGNGCDEQGYNTNGVKGDASNNYTTRKVLDNMSPVNWTHDVLISTLQLNAAGTHYQFKLDINEPGNANSLLSLDGVKLYSTSAPGQFGQALDTANPSPTYDWVGPTSSTLLWDMDLGKNGNDDPKDRSVLLDARATGGPGSGVADMVMLVDKNVIDLAKGAGENYLILWSRFGMDQGAKADTATTAEAGFEEWSYQAKVGTPTNPPGGGGQVPAPATAMLVAVGLVAMTRARPRSAAPAPATA